MSAEYPWGQANLEQRFIKALRRKTDPAVVELGTLRWSEHPTHHATWLPDGATHTKVDIGAGIDVDVVADAHDLPFDDDSFDAYIAVSTWEHLKHPWIAAQEAHRVLRPGGILYVATHHTFPVHGYPSDYCRWTDEGLRALFEWAGFAVTGADFSYPCTITPPSDVVWNPAAPAFLNVAVYAEKP